jgi:hypothetical protein
MRSRSSSVMIGPTAALLMALALLARMLVPSGFMPETSSGGILALVMCSGQGPMAVPMHDGMQTAFSAAHHQDHQQPQSSDHTCPFAAAAAAAALAQVPQALMPFVVVEGARLAASLFARPGLGLAAPPPPKTGPPLLR